ncbi:ATP-binding protein [Streptomyces sp. cmx-4-9]|uniref:ATP-binding protein n=1 Tax=Streptomyces sp. cmx-4-9 TaxID=2790941 RepID=UPI0039803BCF
MDFPTALPPTAAAARAAVAALLVAEGRPLDTTAADDALLVVSELVTSAIRHGGGLTSFEARFSDARLHLSVGDASTAPPVARAPSPGRTGGYGWPLVQCLTEEAAVVTGAHGKTVTTVLHMA